MNNFKICLFLLTIFFCLLVVKPASAQTIPQNASSINVDDLTDQQITQLILQAQKAGLTDDQLLQQAQSKGMSGIQVQKLQSRIKDIRNKNKNVKGSSSDTSANNLNILNKRKSNYKDTLADSTINKQDFFIDLRPKIFGADLFRNSKANTFEPNLNLATPLNYIVGPQDQLRINVFGNSLANWNLDVSPEGNINIPGVGILNVAGKTIEQATAAIKGRLAANNYAIGRGTSVQVSLGNIRSIKVIIQGQVVKPGTYTMSSLATVFIALYAAGGPNDVGSFRQVEVIRNNRIVTHLDLYDFLIKGSQKDNISLQDQDVIRVPTYRIRVELKGEVKIPALFETLPGETVQDVLNFAGGFTDQAYTARIKVDQVSDQQRKITDVFENDYKNYIPLRGDKYTVAKILDRYENRVTIKGAVFRPGEFELQKGLTLSKLINNAGGLKEDAFAGRGSIIRLNSDNTTQQLSFNVADVLNKPSADILLQREDSVTISSVFDLRSKYNVTIKGEVRKPGEFLYADSMKVTDLIIKAGGFSEGASPKRIEVSRRTFNSDPHVRNSVVAQVFSVDVNSTLNDEISFTLKPFDIVSVYSLPGYETQKTVKVEGEVIYPGYYTIQKKNEKISDIITRAGGLTASADIEGSSLKRDNEAVLGVDKTKIDTAELNKERAYRSKRLQRAFKDSLNTDTTQYRNNYVGIDLRQILQKPGTGEDLILENGDVLRVPKQQQIVRVNGEVLYPSAVVYSSGKSFKGYVLNAGGFSPRALKRSAYVVYPNGTVKATTKFLFFNVHPRVKPGSEIYVPKKPISNNNTAQVILGFTTGLASLGAIILGIISLHK
ncbi:SLBB domain-containing protein [Mucilaginibacter sp. OK098]|uniref:SLBB domain-containing protein n=1 Tax=Mucilaginibacter sp. OK098 TaxID=1855297 RepID=UPI0009188690|nr:SLBB domain-containing protein [Mucilaginibacter sp. OK098]SHN13244.1 protein involved in polysaccharide export, contains SLBB domain of the beta-grasp fold [Mucilaginibacter sp. OK098]